MPDKAQDEPGHDAIGKVSPDVRLPEPDKAGVRHEEVAYHAYCHTKMMTAPISEKSSCLFITDDLKLNNE